MSDAEQAIDLDNEVIPTTRPEIVMHMYKVEILEKERIEIYIKEVADPIISFLRKNIESINDVQGIAELVAHPKKTFKLKENLLEEFEENVKSQQNLAGPIGNWTSVVPKIIHDFLLFFNLYYLYIDKFLELTHRLELNEIIKKGEEKLKKPMKEVISRFAKSTIGFLSRLKALRDATEPQHADFKKLTGLIDSINNGITMIEKAKTDGTPTKIGLLELEELDTPSPYGKYVRVSGGAKEPTYGLVISKISSNSQKKSKQIQAEIEANKITKNRNVLKMTSFEEDELFWYLFWPDTTNRTLEDVIKCNCTLIEEAARPIFRQLMQGLRHIHSSRISQNNISPKNVVFYKNIVRISNFSCCRFTEKDACDETYFFKSPYASPESFSKKPYDGMMSDIWSCGIILYEMLANKPPFNSNNVDTLAQKVKRGNVIYPKHFSSQVIQLLKGILCTQPSERLTIEQILSHPWMLKTEEVPISNLLANTIGK